MPVASLPSNVVSPGYAVRFHDPPSSADPVLPDTSRVTNALLHCNSPVKFCAGCRGDTVIHWEVGNRLCLSTLFLSNPFPVFSIPLGVTGNYISQAPLPPGWDERVFPSLSAHYGVSGSGSVSSLVSACTRQPLPPLFQGLHTAP